MENSKLIQLFRTFTEKESRDFSKFVSSPFFNQNKEVEEFYKQIRKRMGGGNSKKMERQQIMSKVYPTMKFCEKKYKYISNLLLKLAEQYISYTEIESRNLIKEYHLLNAYVKRGLDKNYNFIFNKTKKQHQASVLRDGDYYHQEYLLSNVAAQHFTNKKVRKNNEHLENLIDSLDVYYLANRLKHSCHLISDQQIINSSSDLKLSNEIMGLLEAGSFLEYPAIHLYYNLYRLLTEGDDIYLDEIKKILFAFNYYFEANELKGIYYFLINHYIKQLRKENDNKYYVELYETYQKGIESNVLLEDGFLSPWDFKNVVKIGFKLENFKRTEQFILDNHKKLKKEFQKNALHYNMAELFYHKKQYDKSLYNFAQVEFTDIYYNLGTKLMMSKIYYETQEMETLEFQIASFQTYLRRNKLIAENIKQTYLNFTKSLIKILNEDDIKSELINKIKNTSPLIEKAWLLQQCEKI